MNKLVKSLSIFIATLALGFGFASTASAHVDVTRTNPAADSTVDAPLDEIGITFSEPPMLEGSAITVSNQDGSTVDTAPAQLDGAKLYIPWPADIAVGDVTVNFRIATEDGHVVDDSFTFTYTAAAVSAASGAPTPDVTALGSDTPTLVATPMPMAIADEELGEQPESKTWIFVGVGAFVIIAGGLLFIRRNK